MRSKKTVKTCFNCGREGQGRSANRSVQQEEESV